MHVLTVTGQRSISDHIVDSFLHFTALYTHVPEVYSDQKAIAGTQDLMWDVITKRYSSRVNRNKDSSSKLD